MQKRREKHIYLSPTQFYDHYYCSKMQFLAISQLHDKQWDSYGKKKKKKQSITFCKIQLIPPQYSTGVQQCQAGSRRGVWNSLWPAPGRVAEGGGMWKASGKICTSLQKEAWEGAFAEINPSGVIRLNHWELINVCGLINWKICGGHVEGLAILPQKQQSLQNNIQTNSSNYQHWLVISVLAFRIDSVIISKNPESANQAK